MLLLIKYKSSNNKKINYQKLLNRPFCVSEIRSNN